MQVYLGNEEDMDARMKVVDIWVNKSPYENAKHYYDMRFSMTEKSKKTLEATSVALKQAKDAAEKKIKKKEEQIKAVKVNRKIQWFEKFYWFISSENYLVISARDAHQNETLIKKYLAKDDLVFHTQVQGSAFTLVKNPQGGPIPHETLQEAGLATLCHSRCWDQKVIAEVFWVYAEQITKTAPTGQYVPLGSFMIYGKKNFVVPSRLEMGFGLIFKVDEDSIKHHEGERKRRDEGNEAMEDASERLISKAISVQPAEKQAGVPGPELTPRVSEEATAPQESNHSDDGAAGGDSDGEDPDLGAQSVQPTVNTRLTVQRELQIDKDTELTVITNSVLANKHTQHANKKKEKDAREAEKKEAKSRPAPEPKKTLDVVDTKKNQTMSKHKKKQLEKIAQKYGEMDEDERHLQMEMMGSKAIKLSKMQQVNLEKKIREQRGETVHEADLKLEEEPAAEEEEVIEEKGKKKEKGKDKDKKAGKKDANEKPKPKAGPNDKKPKDAKDNKEKPKPKPAPKAEQPKPKPEASDPKPAPAPADQKPAPAEKPAEEMGDKPLVQAPASTPEDEEEDIQDLSGGDDDGDDGPEDPVAENKKETMSILNTILDEEAEKNLNETLEFKEYTGIPKGNGKPHLTTAVAVGKISKAVELLGGHLTDGDGGPDINKTFLLLRVSADVRVALLRERALLLNR